MDYAKSGAPKRGKNTPRHDERGQGPGAKRPDKSELLARMKAASGGKPSDDGKKPAEIEGQPLDRPSEGSDKIAIDEQGTKNIRGPEQIDDPKKK
ncbi:hypothetical protein [Loktanella sp. SALINAS62]|uniref:hypothetical protein n=1 Tax=Loktanella sp. SALINAS62 TaxID=2706124 RepID=UPI001B8CFD3B|nr:hypothetical protein [Loktanella sp. SALINAS62]MBS1300945.1 hypothetical protein [Loktanella sp. SALINAS62]